MKKKTKITILIIIVILILCGIYLHYENTKLQISNYNIINENIPDNFNNYKIVQISDLHNTESKTLINDLIEETKNQKPNIIVITGDLIDKQRYNLEIAEHFIESIKDIAPIYYVSGNHEAWSGKYEDISSMLIENNVHILDNEYDTITINDESIKIIGLIDPSFYPSEISDQTIYDLEQIINSIEEKECFKLLLSHRPELFEGYIKNEIDLVLTGHAHGGQIRIPFIGGLVAPNQGLFPKYTSGTFEKDKTTMIVSRGIGNSIIPFRVNNRPELVVITLNNS